MNYRCEEAKLSTEEIAEIHRNMDAWHPHSHAGFDTIQQEQMVIQYVRKHGRIRRQDAVDLCQIGAFQATRLLDRLVKGGQLERVGEKRGSFYKLAKKEK